MHPAVLKATVINILYQIERKKKQTTTLCERCSCRELSPESATRLDFIELYRRFIELHCFGSFCHSSPRAKQIGKTSIQRPWRRCRATRRIFVRSFSDVFSCVGQNVSSLKQFILKHNKILQKFVTEVEKMS